MTSPIGILCGSKRGAVARAITTLLEIAAAGVAAGAGGYQALRGLTDTVFGSRRRPVPAAIYLPGVHASSPHAPREQATR